MRYRTYKGEIVEKITKVDTIRARTKEEAIAELEMRAKAEGKEFVKLSVTRIN
jgi:hypothetical protein